MACNKANFKYCASQYITDAQGNKLPHKITTLNLVKVTQLYQQSAVATSIDKQPLPAIQINDIIELAGAE